VHKFFRRSPWDVANGLAGKTLKVGDKEGTITRVKPQYPADNANWTDRPLFGPHPVDAYVAPYVEPIFSSSEQEHRAPTRVSESTASR